METLNYFFATLSDYLWGWPLIILLLGTHVFLTLRLGVPQRKILTAIRLSLSKDKDSTGDVSQFGALATALAATIGTGNIVGVATAVALGGPGAVLWCWLSGVFGIATKYSEGLLAVKYRVQSDDGRMLGGPMYALERGLGWKWLAVLFALFTALASFGIGNTVQANAISTIAYNSYSIPTWLTGGFICLLTALVLLGGIRSIARVCSALVPFMAFFYVLGCIYILFVNAPYVWPAIKLICESAFTPQAAGAGLYGTTGNCDANIETVKAFASKAKELEPDYIMFTGDNIAHSVWQVTQEEVIRATRMQIEAIQNEFGLDTPIYPAIGNHEKAPVDEFHGNETELLQGLADIFKPYLDDEAYESFRKYGYYTLLVKNNLRIISINCLLCDSFNFFLIYDSSQTRQMFKWLENVLDQAEKNGEIVHIMDHIPMESTQHTVQCSSRLKILIDRYQNIIRGYFSGHSHSEYLTMIHEYYTPEKPTQINYICSGLTTYSEYQPSFRMYLVDKKELYVQDFIQYRMNLIESNEQRTPIWFVPYYATELFGVDSMNDVENIAKFNITPEYIQHQYTDVPGSEERGKDPNNIFNTQCHFDNDNEEAIHNCTGSEYNIFSNSYLYYILNKISLKWPK